ncbi:hypothetical protein EDD70_2343 [Hydrogenoanaerobacterium saccharovorans]|uniref:Uncharacterized protein n=1 Tax=Hydrogenoanaerobacterium saccharovorans TaxID=474960 RepID=A0A1H8CZX0_9FIRM|nr:conjugal transfer protein TrbL family protein [Hydrogenoanaerobacterium saccharovorans]RPF43379.1 hypothetical protein EDD70_2343 [Hydrogenoanaerobacterium saccharovorans]SEM99914.1 hypothetical protein SAMN05216180_2401 [Hydrogenoanaerobacterium saccharovorans]
MTDILKNFILDIIGDTGNIFDVTITNFVMIVFYADKSIQGILGNEIIFDFGKVWTIIYSAGLSLLGVKCMRKGFDQYILWTDGDADTPPLEMVVKLGKAIAIAVCFPTLYKWLVDIMTGFTNKLLAAITPLPVQSSTIFSILQSSPMDSAKSAFLGALVMLIYLILIVIIVFQFFKKGVEMLVLRLGVPFGIVGYIDSDQGIAKPYFRIFYQCAFTVMIQVVLFKFSIGLWMRCENPAWAIAVMMAAVSTPKFISQFLVQSGGGGGASSSIYLVSNLASRAASLFGK